jgi:PilZ domain
MNEHRRSPRARMLKTGKIVLSDKAPKLECTVRNLSETGACIQVSATFGIPPTFDFILDGVRRHCRVAWIRDTRIGIAFV